MHRRIVFTFVLVAALAGAAVTRVEVTERGDFSVAGYERIAGKVYFAVDPKAAANHIITDIDRAPANAKGLVEFSADMFVLRPREGAKNNGTALVEISNRGGKSLVELFDVGDPLLFEAGYTLVWIGWEFDVPDRPGLLRLYAPVIQGVTGVVRSEIILDSRSTSASLGDRAQVPYLVSDPDSATLTARDRPDSPPVTIPHSQWRFSADSTRVEYGAGFEPGHIYDVVYKAKDPVVAGLGSTAVRDYVSYLKQRGDVKRAIAFGMSQSGRFLRTFLYDGFNADEQGHKVFDGVWAHVGGAGRGSFNVRFAQPSRDGHPLLNFFYPTDIFPFTDEAETDGAITDGLLARSTKAGVAPKIFYTNGSYEYWGRAASLIHTSLDGKRDASPAPDTRIYYLAGTQHGPAAQPVRRVTQNLPNPADYRYILRALLVAMNSWVTDGIAPPDSQIPRIGKDDLVTAGALAFPKIPGVGLPKEPLPAWHLDFGPDFRTKGLIAFEPPRVGKTFPTLVPQVDHDGNETSGIRMPDQIVPLATYTGWNLRDPKVGSPDVTYNMVGSMIPFARTRAEREKSGDPRSSIEERYRGRADYLRGVEQAAQPLVRNRFLLDRDVAKVSAQAGTRWDLLVSEPR